jgi:flagellum-specific peptidoglycan hydrolase FlgJ
MNYASMTDYFDAHATLLTTPHYELCVQAQTPEAYCQALQECGYATAHNYASSLMDIIKVYGLKQYDQHF